MTSMKIRLKALSLTVAVLIGLPLSAQAEGDEMIEEVVVTGSYIARALSAKATDIDVLQTRSNARSGVLLGLIKRARHSWSITNNLHHLRAALLFPL